MPIIPIIQVDHHLTTTCYVLIYPICSQKSSMFRAQWATLLTMEDGECSLIFAKMTNSYVIKVTTEWTYITPPPNHDNWKSKTSVQLRKLTELASSTLSIAFQFNVPLLFTSFRHIFKAIAQSCEHMCLSMFLVFKYPIGKGSSVS